MALTSFLLLSLPKAPAWTFFLFTLSPVLSFGPTVRCHIERYGLQILICSPNLPTDLQSHLHNLTSLHRYIKGSSDQSYPEDMCIFYLCPPLWPSPSQPKTSPSTLSSLRDSSWPVTQARSPDASGASSLHLSHSAPHRACHLHIWTSSQIHHSSQSLACPLWYNCQHF